MLSLLLSGCTFLETPESRLINNCKEFYFQKEPCSSYIAEKEEANKQFELEQDVGLQGFILKRGL